jgi:hypothetical protein
MKKSFYFTALIILLGIGCHSQPLSWVKQTVGGWDEFGDDLVVDTSGNVYVVGFFTGPTDFDPGPGTFTYQPSVSGATNVYIQKLNKSGNLVWVKQLDNGTNHMYGHSICLDPSGNVLITGQFYNSMDFDPGPAVFTMSSTCNQDGFVLKLDNNGNFIWAKALLGTWFSLPRGIQVDQAGNVFVSGYFDGTTDFDPGVGTYTLTCNGLNDAFVTKLDMNGNFLWAKKTGGAADDYGFALTVDGLGNVILTGAFRSAGVDFDPGPGVTTYSAVGMDDIFVQKLDPGGNFVWAQRVGDWHNEVANVVKVDKTDNVYVSGTYVTSGIPVDFDPGPGTYTMSGGADDIFVLKLNSAGGFVWARGFGSPSSDYGWGLALDDSKNVYTSGTFRATGDFDPGPGTFTVSSLGNEDFFVQKMDSAGNFIWAKCGGGSVTSDRCNAVFADKNQYVYATGDFYGAVDFDPGTAVYTLTTTAFSRDAYVIKFGCPNVPPVNATNALSSMACAGGATTLSASGSYNLNWYTSSTGGSAISTGSNFITPALFTNTTFYVMDSISPVCYSDRVAIAVTVVPNPTITVSSTSGSICPGQSATLTAGGANTYTWNPGNVSGTSIVLNPTVTTNYTVSGTNTLNCSNQTILNLVVGTCAAAFTISFSMADSTCESTTSTLTAIAGTTSVSGYTWTSTPAGLFISSPNASVTAISYINPGTYSVTLKLSSGSGTSSITNTITVLQGPTVTSTGPVNPICPPPTSQGPVNLTASGATTYTWLPGSSTGTVLNLSPYPSVSTTYTVIGTDVYGCTNYTTQYVQVLPMPWVYASGPTNVCSGQMNCFSAGGALWNYVWSGPCGFSDFGTAPCFSLALGCGGTFTVGGTDGQCVGETTINISVSPCTSVNEMIDKSNTFGVYPNPAMNELYIHFSAEKESKVSIEILDYLGRSLLMEKVFQISKTDYRIDIGDLSGGIYFLRIMENDLELKTIKFVKE